MNVCILCTSTRVHVNIILQIKRTNTPHRSRRYTDTRASIHHLYIFKCVYFFKNEIMSVSLKGVQINIKDRKFE